MSNFKKELNKKAKLANAMSRDNGWYTNPHTPLEQHMMFVSEIAKATESAARGLAYYYPSEEKPEGELVNLASTVIRIMDYCDSMEWDLGEAIEKKMEYDSKRPLRHKRY